MRHTAIGHTFRLIFFATVASIAAASPSRVQKTGDSPTEALRAQGEVILAATSLEDVIHLMPGITEEQTEAILQSPPEKLSSGLEEWQGDVRDTVYFAERVEGEQAVVAVTHKGSGTRKGFDTWILTKVDDAWKVTGGGFGVDGLPGAVGSLKISGDVATELPSAIVSLGRVNGVPILSVGDLLAGQLENAVPIARVQIPFPMEFAKRCLDPGSMPVAAVTTPGEYGVTVKGGLWLADGDEESAFDQDLEGTLTVVSLDGDLFSGRFEVSANSASGGQATASGTLTDTLMPCAEE